MNTTSTGDWADLDENEDVELPPTEIIEDEKAGTKTVIEYRLENGNKVKVTTKYKVSTKVKKVSKKVAERASWKKFGKALGAGSETTTFPSKEDIRIEDPKQGDEADKRDQQQILLKFAEAMKASNLKREQMESGGAGKGGLYDPSLARTMKESEGGSGAGGGGGGAGGKYVAPRGTQDRDDPNTLRVTNISEDAQERDLQELFRRFGTLSRIYLAKDKETHASRGFAYVSYIRREDAQAAMNALNGYGYDHLILKVEWAAPSTKEDTGGSQGPSKHMSGYGRALPQG